MTRVGAELGMSGLDGATGFRVNGAWLRGLAGGFVPGARDVGGDGIDDLVAGHLAPIQTATRPARPQ